MVNEALEVAMNAKDKQDWTPVSVNVAPATLTILSRQVKLLTILSRQVKTYSDYTLKTGKNYTLKTGKTTDHTLKTGKTTDYTLKTG